MAESGNIFVRYLEQEEYSRWDSLVDHSEYGTIFHKSFWLKTFADWQQLRFSIAGCFKGDQLIGGMAFTWKKKFNLIRVIQMPVKTSFFGPVLLPGETKYLSRNESQLHAASNALIGFMMSGYSLFHAHFPPAFTDVRPYIWNGFTTNLHYTYITRLAKGTDLSASYDPQVRRQIKKGEQLKHSFLAEDSRDLIISAWELEQKSYQRQRLDMRYAPKESFASFIGSLAGREAAKTYTVIFQDRAVASQIVILDQAKSTAYYWLAGADRDYLSTGLNQLLLHGVLVNLQELGYQSFDFVGAGTESIAKYKSTYNFPLVPMFSVSKAKGLASAGLMLKKLF